MRALDLVNYLTLCEDWWVAPPARGRNHAYINGLRFKRRPLVIWTFD